MKIKKKWGLKKADFLKLSRQGHPRTCERYQALYWLEDGETQMEVANRLNRTRNVVRNWQRMFEEGGPEALEYRRTGGKERILSLEEQKELAQVMVEKEPRDFGYNEVRWTVKVAISYCKDVFKKEISKDACRVALLREGVVLRVPKKNSRKRMKPNRLNS